MSAANVLGTWLTFNKFGIQLESPKRGFFVKPTVKKVLLPLFSHEPVRGMFLNISGMDCMCAQNINYI